MEQQLTNGIDRGTMKSAKSHNAKRLVIPILILVIGAAVGGFFSAVHPHPKE